MPQLSDASSVACSDEAFRDEVRTFLREAVPADIRAATPTMEQAGFDNFLSTAWIGIFVSAKTPQGVVSDLERQLAAVMRDPDLQEQIRQMGGIPGGQSPEKFAAFVASERDRWGEVIRASHMTLD